MQIPFLYEGELGFIYTWISEYNHNHRHINNTECANQTVRMLEVTP